jgi:hypothetical protein
MVLYTHGLRLERHPMAVSPARRTKGGSARWNGLRSSCSTQYCGYTIVVWLAKSQVRSVFCLLPSDSVTVSGVVT